MGISNHQALPLEERGSRAMYLLTASSAMHRGRFSDCAVTWEVWMLDVAARTRRTSCWAQMRGAVRCCSWLESAVAVADIILLLLHYDPQSGALRVEALAVPGWAVAKPKPITHPPRADITAPGVARCLLRGKSWEPKKIVEGDPARKGRERGNPTVSWAGRLPGMSRIPNLPRLFLKGVPATA